MTIKQYVNEIITRSCLPVYERKRVKADIEADIGASLERGEHDEAIMARMGDPDDIAAELYENYTGRAERPFKEYKSNITFMGLPLYHIIKPNVAGYGGYPLKRSVRSIYMQGFNIGGRFPMPVAKGVFAFGMKAKGIIAVGNFSAGIIALGNLSAGVISIGNVSAGILSLGNIALALLLVFGNIAAGLFALGNVAVGHAAAGNVAFGQYAVGNEAAGEIAYAISTANAMHDMDAARAFFADAPAHVKSFFDFAYSLIKNFFTEQALSFAAALALCAIALFFMPYLISRLIIRHCEREDR